VTGQPVTIFGAVEDEEEDEIKVVRAGNGEPIPA
jgi:hypothetical protein